MKEAAQFKTKRKRKREKFSNKTRISFQINQIQ